MHTFFSGYARDGGLYFPEKIPTLTKDEIEQLSKLSYPDMVKKIMPLFISEDEIPSNDLGHIIDNAFRKFSGKMNGINFVLKLPKKGNLL